MPYRAIEARGAVVERAKTLAGPSLALGGVVLATTSARAVSVTVRVPRPTRLRVVCTRESVRTALSKLVWGELVVGDPAFDDVVLVRTDTPDATRALLGDGEARTFVRAVVAAGGAVSIDGAELAIVVPEGCGVNDADVAAFVERCWP